MDKRQFLFNRRQFMKTAAGGAALLGLSPRRAFPFYNGPSLQKWHSANPMRHFLNGGLGLAASDTPAHAVWPGATHYTITAEEFTDQLHPSLGPTRLWGYTQGTAATRKHLFGTIVTDRKKAVQLTMVNSLPATNIIPVDTSAFFYNAALSQNSLAVHLHGGFIPWVSDGGPYEWFSPTTNGPSFLNNVTVVPGGNGTWGGLPTGQAEYYWPNDQSARLMWYHDHAHDITRINAYAGLATGYVVRDAYEKSWIASRLLPSLDTAAEIPLIFQDKVFVDPATIAGKDPTWPFLTRDTAGTSNLWYPHKYEGPPTQLLANQLYTNLGTDTGRWDSGPSPFITGSPNPMVPMPDPSCIPEMFGDTMLVNGTAYPWLAVEPRRYRFRVLNACNARFMNLQLYVQDNTTEGISLGPVGAEVDPNGNPVLKPTNANGPAMVQIGNEGGFLPAPVVFNANRCMGWSAVTGNANRYNLLLAPAERADVVIDFAAFAGQNLILYTDAPAPFPGGDIRNDYFFGMPDLQVIGGSAPPPAGASPNTRLLLQIQVAPSTTTPDSVPFATWLNNMKAALNTRLPEVAPLPTAGAVRRSLTLNEAFDDHGRLIQMIGTDVAVAAYNPAIGPPNFFGRFLEDTATEIINAGATEVWELYNFTADVHPIHFHLINLQIINRQPFDPVAFSNGVKSFTGPARLPDANEKGWKETVRMNPGEVTRFVAKFDLPAVPFTVPGSTRAKLGVTPPTGKIYHEYVYHCHILEHEEHDMMRPMLVQA